MNRTEFLDILRSQLSGQMQEGKVAAHIRYYEDYIQSQVRSGRPEKEVLEQLGDPRLIAKTLIDTDGGDVEEGYGEYSSYGSGMEPEKMEEDPGSFHLAGKGSGDRRSSGHYHFTDPGDRSGTSVFYHFCDYSLSSFLAEEEI